MKYETKKLLSDRASGCKTCDKGWINMDNEIIAELKNGKTYRYIANKLHVSFSTIKNVKNTFSW